MAARAPRVDCVDARMVDAGPVAGVLEHRERLAGAEEDRFRTLELAPGERGVGLSRGEEEPVHLVHLREVGGGGGLAPLERTEPLAEGGLDDVGGAVLERSEGAHARGRDRPLGVEPLLAEESARHRRDERRVERREEGELDVDAGHRVPSESGPGPSRRGTGRRAAVVAASGDHTARASGGAEPWRSGRSGRNGAPHGSLPSARVPQAVTTNSRGRPKPSMASALAGAPSSPVSFTWEPRRRAARRQSREGDTRTGCGRCPRRAGGDGRRNPRPGLPHPTAALAEPYSALWPGFLAVLDTLLVLASHTVSPVKRRIQHADPRHRSRHVRPSRRHRP